MFYFTKKKKIKQIQDTLDHIQSQTDEYYRLADKVSSRIPLTNNEASKETLSQLRDAVFDTADELSLARKQITQSDFYNENLKSFY